MKKLILLFFLSFLSVNLLAYKDFSVPESPSEVDKKDEVISEESLVESLPTDELEFVETIGLLRPDEVSKILGEPKKVVNITLESSKEVIASSWYYENINTDYEGNYYPVTEIDIVDGYIESVVFLNSTMEDIATVEGQKYEIKKPGKVF